MLNDKKILESLGNGDIVIEPFDRENLGSSSYDVRLGTTFYRQRNRWRFRQGPGFIHTQLEFTRFACPWSEEQTLWEEGHREAKPWLEQLEEFPGVYHKLVYKDTLSDIPKDLPVIILAPGELILAHTEEYIGGNNNRITTMMKGRSTMGRNGIDVCSDAGWGDVKFATRWTMEIYNKSPATAQVLIPGARIAQIVFLDGDETERQYDGKYQRDMDNRFDWKPSDMLPKGYMDKDLQTILKRGTKT